MTELIEFHRTQGTIATVMGVQPAGRFGAMELDGNRVSKFQEKPSGDGGWINGGFFVLSPRVKEYLDGDATVWEQEPMRRFAEDSELPTYKHAGFWQPMDTLREKRQLQELWDSGDAPWKKWV